MTHPRAIPWCKRGLFSHLCLEACRRRCSTGASQRQLTWRLHGTRWWWRIGVTVVLVSNVGLGVVCGMRGCVLTGLPYPPGPPVPGPPGTPSPPCRYTRYTKSSRSKSTRSTKSTIPTRVHCMQAHETPKLFVSIIHTWHCTYAWHTLRRYANSLAEYAEACVCPQKSCTLCPSTKHGFWQPGNLHK